MHIPNWRLPSGGVRVLESDSGKRLDGVLIAQKRYDEADRAKHELEELQRRDKHLRTIKHKP